jgi:hypothetical protein
MATLLAISCRLVNQLASFFSLLYLIISCAAYDFMAWAIGARAKEPVRPDMGAILVSGSGRGKIQNSILLSVSCSPRAFASNRI